MASGDEYSSPAAAGSDEDVDWEEVDVPQPTEQRNIEITLQARPKQKKQDKSVRRRMFKSLTLTQGNHFQEERRLQCRVSYSNQLPQNTYCLSPRECSSS